MMEKQTNILKPLLESYLTMSLWVLVYHGNQDLSVEQFGIVLEKLGSVEDKLRLNGVSEMAIQALLDYTETLYKTPTHELSEKAQTRMARIIFGGAS